MLQFIGPAAGLLFTLQNIIWINLGVFIGSVFAAIPGLSVILCVILFLPVTYQLSAIPGMMFLLGIYCAGGYGGSVSAILINTPGTPHAAATMLDGHPLSKQGRTKVALKIALYASTFGGVFSAVMLLFLGPQVAQIASQLGTAEYFMVCLFGLTIIAGVSGKSMIKGIMAACIGLWISCIGSDPMTSYDRFTFGVPRLYLGLDLAICLIGLFALVEIMARAEDKKEFLKVDTKKMQDDGVLTPEEKKRIRLPILISSIIGVCVGIIPGTGASEASWFSYNTAKNMSKHKEEFGHGSVEGIAAAESANNAVTGRYADPAFDTRYTGRRYGSDHAFCSDDQRAESGTLSVYDRRRYHVCDHARSDPGKYFYAVSGKASDKAFCKGCTDTERDSHADHCDLLFRRRLLCE